MTRRKTAILDYQKAPVLREQAKRVSLAEIGTKKLGDIIARMKAALHEQEDGVAIAAPQIGVGLRIFMVSGKAASMYRGKDSKLHTAKGAEPKADTVFINPEIIKLSKNKKMMEEEKNILKVPEIKIEDVKGLTRLDILKRINSICIASCYR